MNPISLKQCSALQFPKEKKNTIHQTHSHCQMELAQILDPDPLLFISLVITSSASIHCQLSLDSAKVLAISQALLFCRD